jgi:ACS family hexuronate transporter-like MFS transporter
MPYMNVGDSLSYPRYRWVICALLLLATTSNYVDRQILGILAPELQRELGWSEIEYGHIVTGFQVAYAVGLVVCGWLVDRMGPRWGMLLAVSLWSLAAMAHGVGRTVVHFAFARGCLGLAEAANFPASVKAVSEWFPRHERAFAIGIFNSGSNLGAIVVPLLVPFIAMQFGWRVAFFVVGALGFVWVAAALVLFRSPSPEQQSLLHEPAREHVAGNQRVGWAAMLLRRETRAFATAKFLTDPVWWFYLYWTPKYLHSTFGLELTSIGLPLVVIYLCADVGSIGGGWWSGRLIKRGLGAAQARSRVMLWCALAVLPVVALALSSSLVGAVAILGLATAAHQAWSANLFASVADTVPHGEVGSVIGFGGMAGAIGGVLLAQTAGYSLHFTGSYLPLFMVCSVAYLVAWTVIRRAMSSAPQWVMGGVR